MEQSKVFSFSRVTQPERRRFTPKEAEELSVSEWRRPGGERCCAGHPL